MDCGGVDGGIKKNATGEDEGDTEKMDCGSVDGGIEKNATGEDEETDGGGVVVEACEKDAAGEGEKDAAGEGEKGVVVEAKETEKEDVGEAEASNEKAEKEKKLVPYKRKKIGGEEQKGEAGPSEDGTMRIKIINKKRKGATVIVRSPYVTRRTKGGEAKE